MIFSALLLASIVSLDILAAGFVYGASDTEVRIRHIIMIDIICSALLCGSLLLGFYISNFIPLAITKVLSAAVLIASGIYKLAEYFYSKTKETQAPREMKWPEAVIIALVLSIDGLAAGVGMSIYNVNAPFCVMVPAFSLITGFIFFVSGKLLGKKITKKNRLNLSWLSGVTLIILGALKIF